MKNVYDSEFCKGCRCCELACSFHQQKVFKPSIASIEITGKEKANRGKISIDKQKQPPYTNDH